MYDEKSSYQCSELESPSLNSVKTRNESRAILHLSYETSEQSRLTLEEALAVVPGGVVAGCASVICRVICAELLVDT